MASHRRPLNPAFAAAHGLADESNDDDGTMIASSTTTPTTTTKRMELVLKEARATGKLQACNMGLLSPLAAEFFDFRAGIVVDLSLESSKTSSAEFVYAEETLTSVDFSDNNALHGSALDERLIRYEQVQVLRFKRCGLVAATVELQSLEQLRVLDLEGNQLYEFRLDVLPAHLQELNLSKNQIQTLEYNEASVEHLVSLDLSMNQLETVTLLQTLSLPRLRSLISHHNRLTSFPSLNTMLSLQTLDLSHNLLQGQERLDLSRHTQLQTVLLACNRLTVMPCLPISVTRLDLTTNRIVSIQGMFSSSSSSSTDNSSALVELLLQDNYLETLDAAVISQCTLLRRLDLSANKLKTLPYQLGFLPQLQHLILAGNPLYTFTASEIASTQAMLQKLRNRAPASVDNHSMKPTNMLSSSNVLIHNHKTIYLKGTGQTGTVDLTQLVLELQANPTTAFEITGQLVLDNHPLESLPDGLLESLPNLTELSMCQNAFRTLPRSLFVSCRHLTRLSLAKNALMELDEQPQPLAWAETLTHLDLSCNRLTRVSGGILKQLSHLQVLNLSFNKLTSVDDWYWLPPTLTQLDLSENSLDDVESLILLLGSHCPKLEMLLLQQNDVHRIPSIVGLLQEKCPNLKCLDLKGNPQHSVRPEILAKPTSDQLTYLMNRLTVEQKTAAEMQMEDWYQNGTKPTTKLPQSPVKTAGQREVTSATTTVDIATEKVDEEASQAEGILLEFHKNIQEFERQLENPSLSQAKRYAVKKSLALERSKLIREERKLGLRK